MSKILGLKCDLNVETCVGIMTDLKLTNDWFYSLRWVPPRFFAGRLRAGSQHLEHKLVYRAHKALSPCSAVDDDILWRNRNLTPRQYRDYYKKVMKAETYDELKKLIDSMKF